MSEVDSGHADDSFSAPKAGVLISSGSLLKAAREAQGLHITALAVALKVPVKKLEALEADRFDVLPDMVFVRALAASVCRTLKIDATPILDNLPHAAVAHLNSKVSVMSVPFRAPHDRLGSWVPFQLSKPFIFVALLLLLGMLALIFVPFPQLADFTGALPSETIVEDKQAVSAPAMPIEMLEIVAVSTAAPATLPPTLNPPQAAPSSLEAAPDRVTFTARGASWVEVIDATAAVKLRKMMANGEVVNVSGVVPFSIVVGRADVVSVQWRNKPLDLTAVARDNVARFEVK